jgi:predicted SAM-dependent methyltransferase
MIYTIQNNAASNRVFYDARGREITIPPGAFRYADIDTGTLDRLLSRDDLTVVPATFNRYAPIPPPPKPVDPSEVKRATIEVTGHFGIGDNLHQRAVMRVLMRDYDVWLHTCHFNLFHDLIERGLKLILRPTNLHAQAKTIARESGSFHDAKFPPPPRDVRKVNIGYPKVLVDKYGSILESMFGCVGLKMPERPDFSLPIKPEWRRNVQDKYLSQWNTEGKPLLVHRPVVIRREWDGRSRNPDPTAYDQLYRAIRDQFFAVSIADLADGREWIDGPEQDVNVKLHRGELTFEDMAALFSEADLVFCNAGFAPVLAQAVGTPLIVVYGGRESYRTTQRVGAHLAPILPIDPMNPCDCHSATHRCDKRIDLDKALPRMKEFTVQKLRNTLLFGTFYIDSPDRDNLTDLWKSLHFRLNGMDCDFLAVDSQSPIKKFEDWPAYDGKRRHRMYFNFGDNIGHLSRRIVTQGRDGWGRAFCKGLEIAIELKYEYVVHIEGDSLFRLNVQEITKWMRQEGVDCASTIVRGMRHQEAERQWIETGLMFFSTDYIKRSGFIHRYDWPNRRVVPTPERYIRMQILEKDLEYNKTLRIMPWKALRADKNQITRDNIEQLDLDWVTHQHDSAQQDVYRKFVDAALAGKEAMPVAVSGPEPIAAVPQSKLLKLNLGCGTNKLAGWENHDADVDVTKPLPWPDDSASHISIEHCIEHVAYKAAIEFFKEAYRVLAPGGVLRVTVPSLEQIAECEDYDYHKFTTKWQNIGPTKRGAIHAIIYAHGHEMVWDAAIMVATLYYAGFNDVRAFKPGESDDPVLRGVEGHGKVIGDKFNRIESCTHEARKPGPYMVPVDNQDRVAVVIGGAMGWEEELEKARKLIGNQPIRYFLVNDQIKTFPGPGVACTLHPDKLNGHFAWLLTRSKAGFPTPEQVWSHREAVSVTHSMGKDWGGSTGLFAIQVALREGHQKVILCGVPMTVDGSHYIRHQKWQSAIAFRQSWVRFKNDLAPHLRSMSGWTAEQYGEPSEEWIRS